MKNWKSLLFRSFREGSTQVWRNKFLSSTTILLGGLIIFLLNAVFSIEYFADLSLKNLESRADFLVTIREDYDAFELDALKNELGMYQTKIDILPSESMEGFIAPPRMHIQFANLREVGSVFEVLKKPRYTTVISEWDGDGERDFVTIIDKLLHIRDGVERAGLFLVILFLAGGTLLMVNTFRIVLFTRREEVYIARLVGAERIFIALPFLVEGLILGLASGIFGILGFVGLLREMTLLPSGEIFVELWNNVFEWEILLSGVVGVGGAWISVRKYLRGKFEQ